jgi:chemotaxis protein CheC
MVNARVYLRVPTVKTFRADQLVQEMAAYGDSPLAAVLLGFHGAFAGTAALVFPPDSAAKLVSLLTGESPNTPDLDAVRVGTLNEVGNIVLNGVMGSIGNILKQRINYSLPTYAENTITALLLPDKLAPNTTVILAHAHFNVEEHQLEGDVVLLLEVESFGLLKEAINHILEQHLG